MIIISSSSSSITFISTTIIRSVSWLHLASPILLRLHIFFCMHTVPKPLYLRHHPYHGFIPFKAFNCIRSLSMCCLFTLTRKFGSTAGILWVVAAAFEGMVCTWFSVGFCQVITSTLVDTVNARWAISSAVMDSSAAVWCRQCTSKEVSINI